LHATDTPESEKMLVPMPVHPMPSFEYAMLFMPDPTATHRVPAALHATLCPYKEKMLKLDAIGTQLIPSLEYASELVPSPTAIHRRSDGLKATPRPAVEKMLFPNPFHANPPSSE
jgi:hypothetical protein